MNVLSLFDGKSSGYTALELAGIPVTNYYSAEVDKYAIQVSNAIHPDQTRLGDVTKWQEWDVDWSNIDLLIAGSPCQGFSFAGKQLAFDDPRSKLFFVFVDILNHIKKINPKVKFMLENVKMKKEHMQVIDDQLGVESILINSALVSAQNRQRNYWSNIPIDEPLDRGVYLKDIIDGECSEVNSEGWHNWWEDKKEFQIKKKYSAIVNDGSTDKAICMTARQFASWNGNFVHVDTSKYSDRCKRQIRKNGKLPSQKAVSLCTNSNLTGSGVNAITYDKQYYRKLTPRECFRLQTTPEHYIDKILSCGVSNSQLYKIAGNGWTDEVIAHIFRGLD